MPVRDASRIRVYRPNVDTDADGSTDDNANAAYVCVTGNVSWSGFKRQGVKTTCTESTIDGWGNIVHTFRAGKFIDLGTLSFDVDYDPSTTDVVNSWFRQVLTKNMRVDFPAENGETAGPKLTMPSFATDMVPHTEALTEGDNARCRATMTFKLAGDWTITNAT